MDLEATASATHVRQDERPNEDEADDLSHGRTIGRYLLLGKLGAGAMGVVYAAYDPELDRKVALKLLLNRYLGTTSEGRVRLIREAQALARLSHPNVVAVHDVGTLGDRVWIAMEFVAGETLGAWVKARPRKWHEVLRVLSDAARGVVAAHEAGLVHRDLKPDNIMIGNDGRVRVMDFGLAHGRTTTSEDLGAARTLPNVNAGQPELAALALQLTVAGSIQGTPAYMAPEQWHGLAADTFADQFGWSVLAWEMLYGERPFRGHTMVTLAAAIITGRPGPPPRGRGVPGWLHRVLERGLAVEPRERWPSMAVLLARIERGRSRSRLRASAAVLAVLAVMAAGGWLYQRWDVARRVAACEAAGAEIDETWNDTTPARLRDAFIAHGESAPDDTIAKITPRLSDQALAWRRARTEACMNADVRATWAPEILERALWCLEDGRLELASLVTEFGNVDPAGIQKLKFSLSTLKNFATCTDVELLRRLPPPPTERASDHHEVRLELARAVSLYNAGKPADAAKVATTARTRAAALDWPPLLAKARHVEGNILEKAGATKDGETATVDAYFIAANAGAWDVAARAAADLIYLVGYRHARYEDAREWARHASVAITYSGDPTDLVEAKRLSNLALVEKGSGALDEALAHNERALAIREAALGPDHFEVAVSLNNLGLLYKALGRYEDAIRMHERSLRIYENEWGVEHPDVAMSLGNLASAHRARGDLRQAQELQIRALVLEERLLGPNHISVASTLNNLANTYRQMDDPASAAPLLERALPIFEEALGAEHRNVATVLFNLGDTYRDLEQREKALAFHERALVIKEAALGPEHSDVALSLDSIGEMHRENGDLAKAQAILERALAINEKAMGREHVALASTLSNLGALHLARRRPAEALSLLERAVAIYDAGEGLEPEEPNARFRLSKALIVSGGDRARAISEARKAHDELTKTGASTKGLTEIERWLAEVER